MSEAKDLSVKKYISLPSVFCDLYNGGAFKEKQLLEPKGLQQVPGESYEVFYDKNYQKRELHYVMVIRNMLYDALIYAEQVEKLEEEHRKRGALKCNGQFLSGMLKEDRLNPVILLIFYYGVVPWDGAMDLHSILTDIEVRL